LTFYLLKTSGIQKIDKTITASTAEFESKKFSYVIENNLIAQLKENTNEMHELAKEIEKRNN
jgi:hypothetical protein